MLYALLIVALVFVDVLIKRLVIVLLQPVGSVPLIEGVLHLTYRENTGAAFSILRENTALITVVTLIALCIVLYLIFFGKNRSRLFLISLSMICAGGIGNLFDRVTRGFVVDYIDFRLINFAVFNFADVMITCGAVLLCIAVLFIQDKREKSGELGK